MDFEKHYRRRMKRLKKSLREPFEKYESLQRLLKLMGAQGVFLHMAKQGRWNPWVTFILCLISLVILLGAAHGIVLLDKPWWSWFLTAPVVFLSAFLHFALWRAAGNMRSSIWAALLRAYLVPMLALMFFLVFAVFAVGLQDLLGAVVDGFKEIIFQPPTP